VILKFIKREPNGKPGQNNKMKKLMLSLIYLFFIGLFIVACGSNEIEENGTPTTIVTPTSEALPQPTNPVITPSPGPTITPTQESSSETSAEETLVPTVIPTATAIPEPTPIPLMVFQPKPGAQVIAGSQLTLGGQSQLGDEGELLLALQVGYHAILTAALTIDETGSWGSSLLVPENITGPGELIIENPATGETISTPIEIVASEDDEEPFVTLSRPLPGDNGVAGSLLFFEGDVKNLINGSLTFSVLVDDCTEAVSSVTLNLADGFWYGQLILPENSMPGPSCAIAYTGNEADDLNWRKAIIPINVLSPKDPDAAGIFLAATAALTYHVGETINLYGTAVNTPNNLLQYNLVQDENPGVSYAQDVLPVDAFGYWELELPVSSDWIGPVLLTLNYGDGDEYEELRLAFEIAP